VCCYIFFAVFFLVAFFAFELFIVAIAFGCPAIDGPVAGFDPAAPGIVWVWAAALASTVPARKIPAAAKPKLKPLMVTSNSPGRLRGRPGS
jgi:hypothetical protein